MATVAVQRVALEGVAVAAAAMVAEAAAGSQIIVLVYRRKYVGARIDCCGVGISGLRLRLVKYLLDAFANASHDYT